LQFLPIFLISNEKTWFGYDLEIGIHVIIGILKIT
jgi:hypothetical protein